MKYSDNFKERVLKVLGEEQGIRNLLDNNSYKIGNILYGKLVTLETMHNTDRELMQNDEIREVSALFLEYINCFLNSIDLKRDYPMPKSLIELIHELPDQYNVAKELFLSSNENALAYLTSILSTINSKQYDDKSDMEVYIQMRTKIILERILYQFVSAIGKKALNQQKIQNAKKNDGENVSYAAIFFDEEERKVLQDLEEMPLEREITNMHCTFKFLPTPEEIELLNEIAGREIEVLVTGYACDGKNSGFSITIPDDILEYYLNRDEKTSKLKTPHITTSLAPKARAVNTKDLDFIPFSQPIRLKGRFGYAIRFNNQSEYISFEPYFKNKKKH